MIFKTFSIKILFLFGLILIFNSCRESIENSKYRNANYVFYKEEGKQGFWQKINPDSDYKYKKGKLSYFFDNENRFGEIEVLDSMPNRIERFYDKNSNKLIRTFWIKK